jgi:hypothetical protein
MRATRFNKLTHNNTYALGAVWSPDGNTIALHKHITSSDPLYRIRLG